MECKYQVGAKSIEREEALELAKENEGFTITGKRLALKGDMNGIDRLYQRGARKTPGNIIEES